MGIHIRSRDSYATATPAKLSVDSRKRKHFDTLGKNTNMDLIGSTGLFDCLLRKVRDKGLLVAVKLYEVATRSKTRRAEGAAFEQLRTVQTARKPFYKPIIT